MEFYPPSMEFMSEVNKPNSLYVVIRNTGSTILFWELFEEEVPKCYEESVCLMDTSKRYANFLPRLAARTQISLLRK